MCHLFVDAASTPARVAAVLFVDGQIVYTDVAPDPRLLQCFLERGDKQITTLVSASAL